MMAVWKFAPALAAGNAVVLKRSDTTPVTTLREPAALESAGALIVAMKTPATAEALAALRHADFGVTLSIQNGPLKNELLAQAFGKERVLGALADTSGELLPDGAVLFTRNVNILVGELSGGDSARAQRLARTLDDSGVRAAATPEILTLEWSKFCAWARVFASARMISLRRAVSSTTFAAASFVS